MPGDRRRHSPLMRERMHTLETLNFKNRFVTLGEEHFQAKNPDPVADPYLVDFNPEAAALIDLDPAQAERPECVACLSGNRPLPGAQPLAMAYSGHQFGVYNPRLGDGRGLLLGEIENRAGEIWDLHLKGAGPTRFARGFDGRATLRASIREYLGQEAVHGLGIPTTRSLALIGIRDLIYRETPELAAILVRLADTHIRIGSFELLHYSNRPKQLAALLKHAIARHAPEFADESDATRLLFRAVVQRTAHMIAQWQAFGFIHGVMNTDNFSITGATFDYGPFGFLDRFQPGFTPNLTDAHGRYAYAKQPEIGHWNLSKFAETLVAHAGPDALQEELAQYQPTYNTAYRALMGEKLGLQIHDSEFSECAGALFNLLYESGADYSNFFRRLSAFPDGDAASLHALFKDPKPLTGWLAQYRKLIEREDDDPAERKQRMDAVNPKYILRNYLLQNAIDKAVKQQDFTEIKRLRILLKDPFRDRPEEFERHGIDPAPYAKETPEPYVHMRMSCSA